MAPSPKPGQHPINLIDSANKCEKDLNRLRKHASDRKTKQNGAKKILLEEVITRVNSNIQSLKNWTAAIAKGRQTQDEERKASVDAVFNNIELRVKDAEKALDHRLDFALLASKKSRCVSLQACILQSTLILDQGSRSCTYMEAVGRDKRHYRISPQSGENGHARYTRSKRTPNEDL